MVKKNCELSLTNLPVEIVSKIVESLAVSDQCNVSQTCKHCYNACDVKSIHGQQAIICNDLYSLGSIVRLLSQTKRRYLHLRFYNVKFVEDLSTMWQRIGHKIITIKMFDCEFQSEYNSNTIEHIFQYCDNLEKFTFDESDCRRLKDSNDVLHQTWHSLNERQFIHFKIRAIEISMKMRFPNFDLSTDTTFNFNRLFPNVSEFDLYFEGNEYSYSYLEHSGLLGLMQTRRNYLVKMSLMSRMRWWTVWNDWIAPTTTRLRELTFNSFYLDEDSIRNFFTGFNELEKLELRIDDETSSELVSCVLAIVLLKNKKLRSLKVFWTQNKYPLIIRKDILKFLFNSNFHTLHFEGSIFCDSVTNDTEIPTNESIRNVGIITNNYWLAELFLLKCKRIKYLDILALDYSLVHRIWETQTYLKSLIIRTHVYNENRQSRQINIDISENTKHLEYLRVVADQITELKYVFLNFHFVNLRYLDMHVSDISCEPLDKKLSYALGGWILKNRHMRSIRFTNLQLENEFWRNMYYLEKLEHLIIFEDIDAWGNKQDDSMERKLLQCPQLRVIIRWNDLWYRDTLDRSIKRHFWPWHKSIHVVPNEKVGTVLKMLNPHCYP